MLEERYTHLQMIGLVVMRVLIGWHFLYEGVAKLLDPNWSAAGYLNAAKGPMADTFKWMASTPDILEWVNFLNIWGLTLVGLFLILGLLTRYVAIAGAFMVLLYYLANPPFIGYFSSVPTEGSYLLVNKNLVEIAALFVIAVTHSGRYAGLDRIFYRLFHRKGAVEEREFTGATV
ncbi:MAG TPA: DoxX family protein [Acidobacteriota bacterium]|nr:DoxX family protein [Acidobacteriota bacterium]